LLFCFFIFLFFLLLYYHCNLFILTLLNIFLYCINLILFFFFIIFNLLAFNFRVGTFNWFLHYQLSQSFFLIQIFILNIICYILFFIRKQNFIWYFLYILIFGRELAVIIFLNPLFIFIRSSSWVYIWAIIVLNNAFVFKVIICSKVRAVIIMWLWIKFLINIWKIILIRGFTVSTAAAILFVLYIVFMHMHFIIFH
jgi:hypothetical protein